MSESTHKLVSRFEAALDQEQFDLKEINDGNAVHLTYLGLCRINEAKALHSFFIEKDLIKAKQYFYLYGKVKEYICKTYEEAIRPGMAQDVTYSMLSDSNELIESFTEWTYQGYESMIKKGVQKRILQLILAKKEKEAHDLLEVFFEKHKKYRYKETDGLILKALITKDKELLEEQLNFLLLPKNHRIRSRPWVATKELISIQVLGHAKLAYIRGMELDIDHPLLPKELLPIKPNEEYEKTYDFLL